MPEVKSGNIVLLLIICLILLAGNADAASQDTLRSKTPDNSFQLDASTWALVGMYAFHYERIVHRSDNFLVAVDAGIGEWYFIPGLSLYEGYSMPFTLNLLWGSGRNFFEADLGARYTIFRTQTDNSVNHINPLIPEVNIGYRYQRPDGKGLIFRAFAGISGIGIGIGKAFK